MTKITPQETSDLKAKIIFLQNQLADLLEKQSLLEQENAWFREQFKLQQHRQFGRSSERSEPDSLPLFDEMDNDEALAQPAPEEEATEKITYERRKVKKKTGRQIDLSALPRERQVHDLTDEQKTCGCGQTLKCFGESVSEQLDYIPATLKVVEHVRPKYTCRHCDKVIMAPKPLQALPKSLASNTLIAEVALKKYESHQPFYRQAKLWRSQGVALSDSTLGHWVMSGAQVLAPLMTAFWQQLAKVRLLQCDETPVTCLTPNKKGYLWAYQSLDPDNRFIVFEFALSRSSSIPSRRLADFHGILQTDGYSGYNALRARADIVNLGCWDHARRKVMDVIKLHDNNKTGLAGQLLTLINKLYKIERQFKKGHCAQRYAARQQHAKPILAKIFDVAANANAPPKSALAKAITYLRNNQEQLTRYVEYGDTQMSNCLTENQIRPFALGRKNWLFVGNEDSANKSALWYSLIQSCKINGLSPRAYLLAVLDKVHAMRRGDIDPVSLLPQNIDPELLKPFL